MSLESSYPHLPSSSGLVISSLLSAVNPPDANSDRYSMPMFVHPRDDVDLTPLPEFIEKTGGEALYDSITAGDYLHQRLVEIGLAS